MPASDEHPAIAAVRRSGAARLKVARSDIDGGRRGRLLHKDKFFAAAEPAPSGGFGFCDVASGWRLGRPLLRQRATHRRAIPRPASAVDDERLFVPAL